MKKSAVCVLAVALMLCAVLPAYCHEGPVKKLGRGLANIVTCPCEIWNQVDRTNKIAGPETALTCGFFKGIFMVCARAVVGVYEVATFPFPAPDCYDAILKEPEFFFKAQ